MWFLLQGSIIFAVCASNIRWQLTPNSYVAGMAGAGLAWAVSQAIADCRLCAGGGATRNGPSIEMRASNDGPFRVDGKSLEVVRPRRRPTDQSPNLRVGALFPVPLRNARW
jgi:hypothetical protein